VLSTGVNWLETDNLLTDEGPIHRRFRSAILSVVTPKRVREMEPAIRAIVTELIDRIEPRGECDFMADFAYPLAMLTTLRMIGFEDAEKELDRFPFWADETFKFFAKSMDDEEQVVAAANAVDFQNYVREKLEDRIKNPRDDLMTHIINQLSAEPAKLTIEEMIITFTHTFIGAGQETTKLGLCNMMIHLLSDPNQWQLVKNSPHDLAKFVEETLRIDGPLLGIFRTCIRDTVSGGQNIKVGEKVFLLLGSANHDPDKYEKPDEFCPFRSETTPILTFNSGNHFCVGAGLARLEMRIALELLSQRLPGLHLKDGQNITYLSNDVNRYLAALRVGWTA
jgi:cytochrome P450